VRRKADEEIEMLPGKPRYEYRAWGEDFPGLPRPDQEPWGEETYLVPFGLLSRSIKIRGGALEIKELLADHDGVQLWAPAARLKFPIPALTLERELMSILQAGQPLRRDAYGPEELIEELTGGGRHTVTAVPLRKRRHVFDAHGCRAETAEIEVAGRRLMTAAVEHEDPERLLRAVAEQGLGKLANISYPQVLSRLFPPPLDGTAT
jgi:hypothetical protein